MHSNTNMTHTHQDLLSRLVVAIDRRQRQKLGIWEFSDDPECILRLGLATATMGVELVDGTVVRPGDTIGHIHLWNERLPHIPLGGPDLAWAREMKQLFVHSFRLLACYMVENPAALMNVRAFGGELPLVYTPASTRLLRRLGVEMFDPIPHRGLSEWAIDLGSRLWTWLLRRAFNLESIRGARLSDLQRRPAWISRRTIITLYGPGDSSH